MGVGFAEVRIDVLEAAVELLKAAFEARLFTPKRTAIAAGPRTAACRTLVRRASSAQRGICVEVVAETVLRCRWQPARRRPRIAEADGGRGRPASPRRGIPARAMANAWRMSRSRWLVGSSSTSTAGCRQASSASTSRAFSPPENVLAARPTSSPRKAPAAEIVADTAGPSKRARPLAFGIREMVERGGVEVQRLQLVLCEVADGGVLAASSTILPAAPVHRRDSAASVVLPAPLAPSTPMRSFG